MNRPPKFFVAAVGIVLVVFLAQVHAVLFVDGFTPERHDRFRNDPSFLAAAYDLSGIGRTQGGQWVTLLEDSGGGNPWQFASAEHAKPSGQVSFFPGNDPTVTPVTCSINSGGTRVNGTTDIWMGTLDLSTCNTAGLAGYKIAADDPSGYVGSTVIQAGVSNSMYGSSGSRATNMRFGRNVVTSFEGNAEFIGRIGDWVIYDDDSAVGNLLTGVADATALIQDESAYFGGDSGGPSFLVVGAELQLLGIHSFSGQRLTNDANGDGVVDRDDQGNVVETPAKRVSGDAYLPSSRGAILAVAAVPEPGCAFALSLVSALLCLSNAYRKTRAIS